MNITEDFAELMVARARVRQSLQLVPQGDEGCALNLLCHTTVDQAHAAIKASIVTLNNLDALVNLRVKSKKPAKDRGVAQ